MSTRWKPRECKCSFYYGRPHICNSEKTWIRHIRREARLRAGATDARPPLVDESRRRTETPDVEFLDNRYDNYDDLNYGSISASDSNDASRDSLTDSHDDEMVPEIESQSESESDQRGLILEPEDEIEDEQLPDGIGVLSEAGNDSSERCDIAIHDDSSPGSQSIVSDASTDVSVPDRSATSVLKDDNEEAFLNEIVKNLKLRDHAALVESDLSNQGSDSEMDDLREVGHMKQGYTEETPGLPSLIEINIELDEETAGTDAFADDRDEPFVYENTEEPWTDEELLSFLLFDVKISCSVSRDAHLRYVNLIRQFSPATPYSLAATLRHLEEVTGVRHRRLDCCIGSCMAFTEAKLKKCLICKEDRYDENGEPRATFDYIPLIHRLRLMYSSPKRAHSLTEYAVRCQEEFEKSGVITDIWNGKLVNELRKKGHLNQPTDLALTFHADGVKLFKTRSSFHVWPLMLTIANLPPEERFKRENILLLGVIPGPKQPQDIDSFLRPFVDELKLLEKGLVGVYNGLTKTYFKLRASLVVVGGDTKARELLMGAKGTNSYRYCFYCWAWGLHSGRGSRGTVYCPFNLPHDLPDEARQNPKFITFDETDPGELRLRNDEEWRRDAWHIFNNNDSEYGDYVGINRLTIFAELDSIIFPWAFVPDIMHLMWENCIPNLFNFWRGRFFSGRRQKKFEDTDDEYNIKSKTWERISRGAERSTLPTVFGDQMRSIVKHCHHMSASEWRNAALLLFPVALKDAFSEPDFYIHYIELIEAIESATSTIPIADIRPTIRDPIIRFLKHYEEKYYQFQWDRLPSCLGQIHMLSHVADAVEWAGPMDNYAAWACERMCGLLVRSVKNRVAANRTTSLEVLRREQFYHLPFLARAISAVDVELRDIEGSDMEEQPPDLQRMISSMVDTRLDWKVRRKKRASTAAVERSEIHGLQAHSYYVSPELFGAQDRRLDTHDRRLILQFLIAQGLQLSIKHIPKNVTAYLRMTTDSGLSVRAADLLHRNATRSASYIEYRSQMDTDEPGESGLFYGRLQLLMKVDVHQAPLPLFLALVRDLPCMADGRLQRIVREGKLWVISASDITDLVGLVVDGISENKYIVKKSSALLVAPEDE